MRIGRPVIVVALAAVGLTRCSTTPTTRQLAQDAVTAMGGAEKLQSIQTLVMKDGTGTRTRLGQTVHVADAEMPAQLTKVVETADLANGRASLDYELKNGDFMQHRHVDPMVVAYVPSAGALFQSDLFFPGTGGNPSPEAQHLLESVRKLSLRVTTNVGGHGGVGPFAELVKAGTPARPSN